MGTFCSLNKEEKQDLLNILPAKAKEILLDFIRTCYYEHATSPKCDICGIITNQAHEVMLFKNMRWLPFAKKPPIDSYIIQPFVKVKEEE